MTDFVDLPPAKSGPGSKPDLAAFAADLRVNPGAWAVYPRPLAANSHGPCAHRINKGDSSMGAGFRAAVRSGILYVSYVGAA